MKTTLDWMELTQEADFSVPLFDLPGRNTEVLQSLHRSIHPRYALRSADMQAFGGTALSEVSVRLNMFEGRGTIAVTADKLSAHFRDLAQDDDIRVCNECSTLAAEGLRGAMPDVEIAGVATRTTLGLRLDDGSVNARSYLAEVVKPSVNIDLRGFGNARVIPCINLEVHNADEDWKAVLHAYDNASVTSAMIVSIWLAYPGSLDDHPQEERTDRVLQLRTALLQGMGLETPTPSGRM